MAIKKVLIIRTGAIGDVVHTTALFHAIKKAYPSVEIHYLTSRLIKPLIVEDIALNKVITINTKFKFFSKETKELINQLKQERYDAVLNLQPSLKVRLLCFLSGIKKQYIYKKNFKLHAVTNFWKTGLKAFPEIKEEKEIKLYLPKDIILKSQERMKDFQRPIFIINAGGIMSKRQGRTYPIDKWVQLGNKIQEKFGGTIILNGAKEDRELLLPLNEIKNSVNYIGELPLIESCAVISQADYMISGDSGPLHIATALGVKSIGLYGSMPSNRTGCYCCGINIVSEKPCVPCNRRKCKFLKKSKNLFAPCMREIDTQTILNELF